MEREQLNGGRLPMDGFVRMEVRAPAERGVLHRLAANRATGRAGRGSEIFLERQRVGYAGRMPDERGGCLAGSEAD